MSSSSSWSSSNNVEAPALTSHICTKALETFVRDPFLLAVATEASSHPSGLDSLYAQPYVWGGGGLGNMLECPLQTCLAGGTSRDSITFAAVCIPSECTALDLAAHDFVASLELVSEGITDDVAQDYLALHQHIASVNEFLKTGWTCGDYKVPWSYGTGTYALVVLIISIFTYIGTFVIPKRAQQEHSPVQVQLEAAPHQYYQEEKKDQSLQDEESISDEEDEQQPSHFWSAWNVSDKLQILTRQRPDTAALDGLRVGSILWVIFGHITAIQSSSAGGYNNPAHFLPPNGFTTTWAGQIVFASRFAVDTFLFLSGYLVVRVLVAKFTHGIGWKHYLPLILHRLVRILPLYYMTLGFYTHIAPHLAGGPFWYQWQGLLEPCRDYGWTNWLFVNNFVPFDMPNTATCFYHSWYLAVDLQLFLLAPLVVMAYQRQARLGKLIAGVLLSMSLVVTMYLTWVRQWSLNTFDGAAVARFDVEAYAKPHVRAQAYLAGMLLAMRHHHQRQSSSRVKSWNLRVRILVALFLLAVVTFGTVTGAYSRRPCLYKEWPFKDNCGSIWSRQATFWYTATSRAAWALAIWIMVDTCLLHSCVLGDFLSCRIWTPMSHLSFGAYLVHPIVIFVWQLGNMQKSSFRFLETGMDYVAVCVVSFGFALLLALVVELPCAALSKHYLTMKSPTASKEEDTMLLMTKTDRARDDRYGSLYTGTITRDP